MPVADVHLSDLRDAVFDVPAQVHPRPAGGNARRRSPAQPRLPALASLGGRQSKCQGADQAKFDDRALPVAAVHAVGDSRHRLLEQLGGARNLHCRLRRELRFSLQPNRSLQSAVVADRPPIAKGFVEGGR